MKRLAKRWNDVRLSVVFAALMTVVCFPSPVVGVHAPLQERSATLKSSEGRFSVQYPRGFDAPKQRTDILQTPTGELEACAFVTVNERGGLVISFADAPKIFENITDKEFLERLQKVIKNSPNIVRIDEIIPFEVAGSPGRAFFFEERRKGRTFYLRRNYLIVTPRIYQIMYVTANIEEAKKSDINEFFDSFTLIQPESSPERP